MPISVLVVDDDKAVLKMLSSIFEANHFEVSAVESGAEALNVLTQRSFDLVLTDMRMETPTAGFDVVRAARARPEPPVIVILSAYPIPPDEWKRAGADALFQKGGGLFRVLGELRDMVDRRARALGKSPQPAEPPTDKQKAG
jgi:CheY-like chemotaxis protein